MFLLKADQMKRYEKEKVGVPFSLFLTLYASVRHVTLERVSASDETEETFPYRGISNIKLNQECDCNWFYYVIIL